MNSLELLAPVGSIESFFAAVENGADAIFCGLKDFSARAKAKNFTLQELEQLVGYAKERGVKVYVALNTLIKDSELASLVELLAELERQRVDGLIIQDLGLYRIVHNYFPELPLHASTQMLIHNLTGVLQLEQMGFRRVVLARELSLKEITYIGNHSSIELEHFIHGALCYSMSGHCLFSSYIDGRSGNRGRCIQPCRRRYHLGEKTGFYYSTSDFSAIEYIPDLIRAGVTSFKIEGRMKSAEYVAGVVSSYRMVLDAGVKQRHAILKEAQEKLAGAMGRTSSHGFLQGTGNKEIVLEKQKGGIGRIIGQVERSQGKFISFRTDDVIYVGDRLRVQPRNDRAGKGFTVRNITIQKRTVKRAGKGSFVSIPLPFKMKVSGGDPVFKLSTGKEFTMSVEACRRRLQKAPRRSYGVDVCVVCTKENIRVRATVAGTHLEKQYPVQTFAATRSPLSQDTLKKVFASTGYPAFRLADLIAENLPPVVIKPSRLKEIRRDFYHVLFEIWEKEQKETDEIRVTEIQSLVRQKTFGVTEKQEEQLYVVSDQIQDVVAVAEYPELQFVFPLAKDLFAAARQIIKGKATHQQHIIWDLPSIVFDGSWSGLKALVDEAIQNGFSKFRLNNLSHFQLFDTHSGANLFAGSWLYSLNNQSIQSSALLGIQKWTLSIEDESENVVKLLQGEARGNLLIMAYSPVDLFTSRVPPSVTNDNFVLKNDMGESLNITHNNGLTVTRAEKPFSIIGQLQVLREKGGGNFVLDLRGIGLLNPEGQEIIQAFYEDSTIPGTTVFNFERGLQ